MKLSGSIFAAAPPGRAWVVAGCLLALPVGAQDTSRYPNDGGGFNSQSSYIPIRPYVICFPPTPPPLDRAISHVTPPMAPKLTPPAELASFLGEPFYAPLSTWLLEKTLTEKMQARLGALRTAKANALTELRAALDQVRDAEPVARRRALTAFARQQGPALAALEREAGQIRAELVTSAYDWRALREWSLGERNRRGDSPMEIAATMRAYAYYQAGLSDGQRRLLREISLELAVAGEDAAAAQAAQPFLFFSPEPARVLLPDDLPAALATKVAAYQTKKSALKKDLYDAIYKQDGATIGFLRTSALHSLAEKQAASFADLEKLAEDIRLGLAELPSATRPAAESSALPPVLTGRLDAVVKSGITLQKETIQKIDALRVALQNEPLQITYSFESSGLKFSVVPQVTRASSIADARAQLERVRPRAQEVEAQMTSIAEDFGRRLADLVNESDAIRLEATAALGNPNARVVEGALATARRASALKDSEDAYREYRLAVFEPGMSPEQRRLLFAGALEKLDIPLLRGEFQPVRRAAGW